MTHKEQFLTGLAKTFQTDKEEHGYMKFYAHQLPIHCRSMMEIGVARGASAKLWNAFYGSQELDLYLMDLYLDRNHVSPRWIRNNGWVPLIGDQSDEEFLASIKTQFEIIIDDGSHNAHHQLISFKHLFLNNLRPDGLYVIEDLHCNKDNFYNGGKVEKFEQTPLAMLKKFTQEGEISNPYFNIGESGVFKSLIDSVKIYDEKIAFIKRKP